MRRFLLLSLIGIAASAAILAQANMFLAPPPGGGGGASPQVWSATHIASGVSGGGTTTVTFTGTADYHSAFGADTITTGKYYAEFVVTLGADAFGGIGLGNINATVANGQFVGSTADSIAWLANGSIYLNSSPGATIMTIANGNRVAMATDRTNSKVWFKNLTTASGWNNAAIGSQDPANNIGGTALSTVTTAAISPGASFYDSGDSVQAFFSSSGWAGTAPTGFSQWP